MSKKNMTLEERVQVNMNKYGDITNADYKNNDVSIDESKNTSNDVSIDNDVDTNTDTNVDKDVNINSDINITITKKDRYMELHDRKTYYIFKPNLEKINFLERIYKQNKSYTVNEALKLYFSMLEKSGVKFPNKNKTK